MGWRDDRPLAPLPVPCCVVLCRVVPCRVVSCHAASQPTGTTQMASDIGRPALCLCQPRVSPVSAPCLWTSSVSIAGAVTAVDAVTRLKRRVLSAVARCIVLYEERSCRVGTESEPSRNRVESFGNGDRLHNLTGNSIPDSELVSRLVINCSSLATSCHASGAFDSLTTP